MCWEEILYTLTDMSINRANQLIQRWTQWLTPLKTRFTLRKLFGSFCWYRRGFWQNIDWSNKVSAAQSWGSASFWEQTASMLSSRCIIRSLIWESMQVASVRGCLQGGILSPLLWNLTMDELLWDLSEAGYYSIGYADDIAIIIRGKFPSTVSEVLQNALRDWKTCVTEPRFLLILTKR